MKVHVKFRGDHCMSWRSVRHLFTSAGIVGAAVVAFAGSALPVQAASAPAAGSAQASPTFATNGSFGPIINFNGKCLDMTNRSTQRGTQPQIWTCNGQPQQQWGLVAVSSRAWLIQNENSRLCLSVLSRDPGDVVIQETCTPSDAFEQWELIDQNADGVEIANVGDGGLVMQPSGCGSANGTKIVVAVPNQCPVDRWHG